MYNPSKKNEEWLNWLLKRIDEVPYDVTARWAFYRCVEEFNFKKSDYKMFLSITSKARKNYWNGWNPQTLPDDTRTMFNTYGHGYPSIENWIEGMADQEPILTFEKDQPNIVFVCFEAKAMIGQFRHYLDAYRVCLIPFGGDPSIPFKYQLSQNIKEAAEKYEKPIKVLYFGDYDPKGMLIPECAMRDIKEWAGVDFEYMRIGINSDHVSDLGITEDPRHPGKFQWEALDEHAAEKLINKVFKYWSKAAIQKTLDKEERAGEIWSEAVQDAIEKAKELLDDE